MTELELEKQRNALVVKSNALIRQSRFNLSTQEQKIVLYMVSKLRKDDETLDTIEFSVRDFCEVCGIKYRENSQHIKETIKHLRDKSIWVTLPNGVETTVAWIEKPYIDFNSGIVRIRLDRDMMPYLLHLQGNFTQYELYAVLALRSKFSLRLFELFKSYLFEGSFAISLAELKNMLMLRDDEYPKFYDFKRYVIDKAIDEIERYTPLKVTYGLVKRGRAVSGLSFVVEELADYVGDYSDAKMMLDGELPSRYQEAQRWRSYMQRQGDKQDG